MSQAALSSDRSTGIARDFARRLDPAASASRLLVGWLLLTIALPLWSLLSKSFQDGNGNFVGLANYIVYFSTPTLFGSIYNSVWVAVLSTVIVIPIAFIYAYTLTRTKIPMKGLLYSAALLPLFAPSLLSAISLIYLFGNQGLLKGFLFGGSIYGPAGIVLAQVFYCFPHALIILVAALGARGCAPLRGCRCARHREAAHFPHRDASGREIRPDQCLFRRLHAGGHRFRHRQGDRRAIQRAGDRRLQAGRRPAEFRHGRGGRHGAAGPGGCWPSSSTAWCSGGRWRSCRRARCRSSRSRTSFAISRSRSTPC